RPGHRPRGPRHASGPRRWTRRANATSNCKGRPCVGGAGSKRRWWRVTPSVGAGVSAHLGPGGGDLADSTTTSALPSSYMRYEPDTPQAPIESAELISVGTELLLGEIVDTNSAYLASYLAGRGVDVLWSARVGDNLDRIRHLLETGLSRSDLVVLGGGLGPTEDDLTRDAVAAVVGEEQTVDPELERWLRAHFASGARPMPERNLQQ